MTWMYPFAVVPCTFGRFIAITLWKGLLSRYSSPLLIQQVSVPYWTCSYFSFRPSINCCCSFEMPGKHKDKSVIQACDDLIRSFNPVTHSIDTHCSDALGDVTSPVCLCTCGSTDNSLSGNITIDVFFSADRKAGERSNSANCVRLVQGKTNTEGERSIITIHCVQCTKGHVHDFHVDVY